jgi:hypothetical protein
VKLSLFNPRKHIERFEVLLHSFLSSALVEGDWTILCPDSLSPLTAKKKKKKKKKRGNYRTERRERQKKI